MVRKGMVLLDITSKPKATKSFECEVTSLESTERTIKYKFEPLLIINNIRQCCKIKKINNEDLTSISSQNNSNRNRKLLKNKPLAMTPSLSDNEDPFESFSTFNPHNTNTNTNSNIVGLESTINSSHIGTTSFISESNIKNNNAYNNFNKKMNPMNEKPMYFKDNKSKFSEASNNTNNSNNDKNVSYNKRATKGNDGFIISKTTKVIVNFEFKNFPEYLEPNMHVIINEPYMKALCFIRKLKT